MPGIDRAAAGTDRKYQEHAREPRPEPLAPPPSPLGAADNVVGADANQAGDRLGEANRPAVGTLAQVGAEDRQRMVGDSAVRRDLVAQRRGGVVGPVTLDYDRDHGPLRM